MKILYATMQFGRGYGQGTERYVSVLTRGLRERGHETAVLAGDPEGRGPDLPLGAPVEDETSVYHYPSRGWMGVEGLGPEQLQPILHREKPDLVHIVNPAHIGVALLPAARRMNIPAIITIMDYWWLCPKHTLRHPLKGTCDAKGTWRECVWCTCAGHPSTLVRGLSSAPLLRGTVLPAMLVVRSLARGLPLVEVLRWRRRREYLIEMLNRAHAIIFPSRAARQALSGRLGHGRVCSIPYGLEPRWFSGGRPSCAADGPISPGELTIGYAGALAEHKGVHLLLEAVRSLGWTATRVRLAGRGEDRDYIRRLHRLAEGLSVDFVGPVPSSQMPDFLGGLDVLVVPSVWPENLPIVVLEARAVGVPVLASRVDGITEMIDDDAYLFDVDSASSLSERLSAWAAAPTSPATANVSTAAEMVDRTFEVYQQYALPWSGKAVSVK